MEVFSTVLWNFSQIVKKNNKKSQVFSEALFLSTINNLIKKLLNGMLEKLIKNYKNKDILLFIEQMSELKIINWLAKKHFYNYGTQASKPPN